MIWNKLGLLFDINNYTNEMVTHARMPTPMHIGGDTFRIYFESRNSCNIASPYFLDFDVVQSKITSVNQSPLLNFGPVGTFDDNGITPFSILRDKNQVKLYYVGWNLEVKVPFSNAVGLAISEDGGQSFQKHSLGPIFSRDLYDPYFPAGHFVMFDEGVYKMWYTSFERWVQTDSGLKHYYNIKYRESIDGIDWLCKPLTAITFQNDYEYSFHPRTIIKENNIYKMWYSYRAQSLIESYRFGYAESKDGIEWSRMDERMRSFDVSSDGWDSEMVCYPYVFDHAGSRYMLYNGNGYGKTGFGLAVLEKD